MRDSLTAQIQDVLSHARGMPEPRYDSTMEAANWPVEFRHRLKNCIGAISRETDSRALKSAVNELERLPADVPEAIGTILVRALYDNENTPMTST